MRKILAVMGKLLYPPKWVLFLWPPIVYAVLIYIFLIGQTENMLAYLIYTMSAYCLTIWLAALPRGIRQMKSVMANSKVMQKLMTKKIIARYLNDIAFRGSVASIRAWQSTFFMLFSALLQVFVMLLYGSFQWQSIIWYWGGFGFI